MRVEDREAWAYFYWRRAFRDVWELIGMCHRAYSMGYRQGAQDENRRLWEWWDSL